MPKLGNNLECEKNQLLNAKLHNVAGDIPALDATFEGIVWFDTAANQVKACDGTGAGPGSVQKLTNIIEGVTAALPMVAAAVVNKNQVISINPATTGFHGSMSAADKTKLDGISAGAGTGDAHLGGAETFTGVKTFTPTAIFTAGATGITKTQVGLGSVDNTADTAKPVSTAQLTALNLKANLAGPTFTGTVTVPTPAVAGAAATKGYVDAVVSGLDIKKSVRCMVNGTFTYATTGGAGGKGVISAAPLVVDGVTVAAGDRILVNRPAAQAQNGIWEVITPGTANNGVWHRPEDFMDGPLEANPDVSMGAFVFVEAGTSLAQGYVLNSSVSYIDGASGSALTFAQFSSNAAYTAGNGLVLTGASFDVVGTANRILANADSIDISPAYVGQASITTVGAIATGSWNADTIPLSKGGGYTDTTTAKSALWFMTRVNGTFGTGAATTLVATHNLGTKYVTVSLHEVATGEEVFADMVKDTVNTVTFYFSTAPASASLAWTVIG